MCDKCTDKKKYWVHIADKWTKMEKKQMIIKYIMTIELLDWIADEKGYVLE